MSEYTESQEACIALLEDFAGGRHHLPKIKEFGRGVCVNYRGDLSTFDSDKLTRLVILAHKRAIRIEIGSSGPGMVKIIAHKRQHGDRATLRFHERHPTLMEAIPEIQAKNARIAELEAALRDLFEEYDDRAAQWGSEYLWQKHEDSDIIARARKRLTPTPPKP